MNKSRLFLAVALLMCFSVGLAAQENKQGATDQKAASSQKKKAKGDRAKSDKPDRSSRLMKQFTKGFAKADLTDEQTAQIESLLKSKMELLAAIQKKNNELMSPEDRKKRAAAMKAARQAGKSKEEVQKAGFEAIGMSEEVQKSLSELTKKRAGIMTSLKKEAKKLLSDEQVAALSAGKKGKGKAEKSDRKKGDGEKKRGKKKGGGDGTDSLQLVSIKLPNMT